MKQIVSFNLLVALVLGLAPRATALRLDFASVHAHMSFDGTNPTEGVGTFVFVPFFPGNQFMVTESDGTGSARDLLGRIDGTFSIGAITVDGVRQTAPVLGEGTLRIRDGVGHELTGALRWEGITTSTSVPGAVEGYLNPESFLNLTGITYDGPVADLVALATAGMGRMTVRFDFHPSSEEYTLMGLTRDGVGATRSFYGSIVTIPEPAAWALWGLGLAGLACGARRKAKGHHARGSR